MSERIGSVASCVSGSRWSDMEGLVIRAADKCGLEITIRHKTNSIFKQTVFYKVEGLKEGLELFIGVIEGICS